MSNIVLLNNLDHADLRVAPGYGAAFGDAINQVLVFPTEFEALQREYVILFRKDPQGAPQAVALLGLDRDENLFLDGPEWRARYVPAIQRRGPFSIGLRSAQTPGSEPDANINVDLDHPRITGADGAGEAVFRRHGGATPYLDTITVALADIYEGLKAVGPMFEAFDAAGLIEPVAIDVTTAAGVRYDLEDIFTVSRERLAALDGAALERLHRGGWLTLAIHVVSSLSNLGRLVEMKDARQVTG